jgi:hypothetical protein
VACASLDVTIPRRPLTLLGPPPANLRRATGASGAALLGAAESLAVAVDLGAAGGAKAVEARGGGRSGTGAGGVRPQLPSKPSSNVKWAGRPVRRLTLQKC